MTQKERGEYLLKMLIRESKEMSQLSITIPKGELAQWDLMRALFNVRPPRPATTDFLRIQDAYLRELTEKKGITQFSSLRPVEPHTYLWRGDITTLACDAIVNAANRDMLGCFVPGHKCIDNAIHSFSGIQLRLECSRIMHEQGHVERTGTAKMTNAYNLPCRRILHTVGPIVRTRPTKTDQDLLASCYWSCLELADQEGLGQVAFCCISTGEFRFPAELAAQIAVDTVNMYREQTGSQIDVIYDVFTSTDFDIYEHILKDMPATAS